MRKHYKIAAVGQALGLAVAALSVLLLAALALGPRTGIYRTVTVLTSSMRPSMPEGSVILQTPVDPGEVRVGDVITYRIPVEDHRVVTHRVVQLLERGRHPVVRTEGDAAGSVDPWVARLTGEKVWRVQAAVPRLGYVLEALRRPEAKRVTLVVVPLMLALVWLRDIWRPRPVAAPRGTIEPHTSAAPPRWQGLAALAAIGALALVNRPRGHRA